jgi:putative transposase
MFGTTADYRFFHHCLANAARRHRCLVHAYVLMTNHVHLLITPASRDGIGRMMQSVGRRYVQYFNNRYGRTGTLWEGRYRATLIDTDQYLLTCYRYIELNPVRAGLVTHPAAYPWSSYAANALGDDDSLLTPHALYLGLDRDAANRRSVYRALFQDAIEASTLDAIRRATNAAWVLGSDRFRRETARLLNRRAAPLPKGRPRG